MMTKRLSHRQLFDKWQTRAYRGCPKPTQEQIVSRFEEFSKMAKECQCGAWHLEFGAKCKECESAGEV